MPPLQVAAWIPWRAVGIDLNGRQAFVLTL